MRKPILFVGFRLEIASKMIARNLINRYNKSNSDSQLFDLYKNGKINVEKKSNMLMVCGNKVDRGHTGNGMANFSVMVPISKNPNDVSRLVQIINVLGNDRLIREKVDIFASGKSMLNALPELAPIKDAIIKLDKLMPGFMKSAWLYAPEARFQ